jgi:AcrR family transcriptional regulator
MPPSQKPPIQDQPLVANALGQSVDWSNRRIVQILGAAGKCFSRRGYAETSIKEIASKVGMTKSMVHYYFSNKAHLLHEVLAYSNYRHLSKVTRQLHLSEDSSLRRARQALNGLWQTLREERRFLRLLIEFWSVALRDPELHKRLRDSHQATRKLVAQGIADALGDDARKLPVKEDVLAALILAVLHGLAVQDYAEPDAVDVDLVYRVFVGTLTAGMANLNIA